MNRDEDLPPEIVNEIDHQSESQQIRLDEAVLLDDVGAHPDPDAPDERSAVTTRSSARVAKDDVAWPTDDADAPDYAYLASIADRATFELTPDILETLLEAASYAPNRSNGVIAFALRGAALTSGHEIEGAQSLTLENLRPDHRRFRCVIGFYFTASQTLNVYTGSTVPCRKAVAGYANGGSDSNMLPTGLHTFYVWRHRRLRPALRLGKSASDPETGALATVLRSTNNGQMETYDLFDLSRPLDNVHCSYFLTEQADEGAFFSSWGCLTVRGQKTPSEQWAKFQAVLDKLGEKTQVDLLLATGKDAAVAANPADRHLLTALRHGSRGAEVERLQHHLGISLTGYLGARTLDKMTGAERAHNAASGLGRRATGVYTPALDAFTGWAVFDGSI